MRRLLAALALAAVTLSPVFLGTPEVAHAKANLTTVSDIKVAAVVATDNQPLPQYTPVVTIVKTANKKTAKPIIIRDIKVERQIAERKRLAERASRVKAQQAKIVEVRKQERRYVAPKPVKKVYASKGKTSGRNWATPGQCTWGALEKWRQATGSYMGGFFGNAMTWGYRAQSAGYSVGSTPRARSVLVMQPGVHGSSSVGHVAWVTGVSGNKVTVVEMNALAGPYNWNTRTLNHQGGMQYIYSP